MPPPPVERVPPPPVERLNGGRPLLERDPSHPWENRVTFNPGCALIQDRSVLAPLLEGLPFTGLVRSRLEHEQSLVAVLYRAQGDPAPERDYTRSSQGLALFTDALEPLARHPEPVIVPEFPYESLGVEDGRITRVADRYVLMYAAYGATPRRNEIRIAMASTSDFLRWTKLGLLRGDPNRVDNKNAMLWEGMPGGRYLILHRPMQGKDAMAIHWAESDQVTGSWRTRGLLMAPLQNPEFIDTWIGGGAPPLHLDGRRYLILYHIGNRRADRTREYDLGLALADLDHPGVIVKRSEPLLRPETPAELAGDPTLGVSNVAFVCGAYFRGPDLYFPYAGADSVVLGARIRGAELNRWIG